ncbi:hypothetical protein [Cronobacter sp. JZ38]|uniref:hypothetical protein n=1 Tax=Cronobacter sp. JZ38 TaxID=1906275 RepID=UPI0012A179A3|nr:hypothetical protein [Cronobacter sp. JZ38]
MTITSGWIGSSAAGETAQRWMSGAGPAISVGVPFWMSALVGKSKGLKLNIQRKQIGVLPPGVRGPNPFPILVYGYFAAQSVGSISGDYNGRQVTALYFANHPGYVCVTLAGAMSGSISLVLWGARYTFSYNTTVKAYAINNTTLQNKFMNSVGATIDVGT